MGAKAVPPAGGRHPEALGVVVCCALRGCQQCAADLQHQHCHVSKCADRAGSWLIPEALGQSLLVGQAVAWMMVEFKMSEALAHSPFLKLWRHADAMQTTPSALSQAKTEARLNVLRF